MCICVQDCLSDGGFKQRQLLSWQWQVASHHHGNQSLKTDVKAGSHMMHFCFVVFQKKKRGLVFQFDFFFKDEIGW